MRPNPTVSSSYLRQSLFLLVLLMPMLEAAAEKADSLKKAEFSAEYSVIDGKKNTTTLSGNVELTRGSMIIRADRAVFAETAEKSRNFNLYGTVSDQVFFRQKRDGGPDLWMEGVADHVEYDEKTEMVKFISKARVRYLEGKRITQEQVGEFLSYDSLNDVFVAANSSSGKHIPGAGRVTLTIEPKIETKTETKIEKK